MLEHLYGILRQAKEDGLTQVFIHGFTDGRDTPPQSGVGYVRQVEEKCREIGIGKIASVCGRFWSMDRDNRWERVERGYDAIVHGVGERASSAIAAIEAAYARGEDDEFVTPTVIEGVALGLDDRWPIIHANFRADRARQLTHALADLAFDGFDRRSPGGRAAPTDLFVVTMTAYQADLLVQVAFPPEEARSLAQAFSDAGWRQSHIAETEKYAHVTYLFNGGVEPPYPGEERVLVPSPKVATYDLAPAMSAEGVTDALVEAIVSDRFDFIVANYANPDMVGHTGSWDATLLALATIDACLARVVDAVQAVGAADPDGPGALLAITADHGNADCLRDAEGHPVTAHSLNPVPLVLIGRATGGLRLTDGVLADVAPTLLSFTDIAPWPGTTGRSLCLW